MTTILTRAEARADTHALARTARIHARLKRFRLKVQPAVRALAARHPRLADLADSFPALLFSLAFPRAGQDVRAVIAGVIAGDTLAALAHQAHVPLWLRKAPPEAFERRLDVLPDGPSFRRQIGNHFPASWARGPHWLEGVANMARWADETAAIWFAREMTREWISRVGRREFNEWRLLALWAWHSAHEGVVRDLIATPFDPSMAFDAASAAAYDFRENLALFLALGDDGVADPWLPPGSFEEFVFEPLATYADIVAEARAMRHCVRCYGDDVLYNRCRLYSMRKDGARVATVRIAHPPRQPMPQVVELQGVGNADAPTEIWWAARRWLMAHDLPNLKQPPMRPEEAPFRQGDWVKLWKPYWLAKRRIPPWLPLCGSRGAVHGL